MTARKTALFVLLALIAIVGVAVSLILLDDYAYLGGGVPETTTTVTDVDGNEYKIAKIGDREWMIENLRVLHYRNGTPINNVWAYDDNENNVAQYGRLYTWDAVGSPLGICPGGWHVATDDDWKIVERMTGMHESEIEDTGWRGKKSEGIRFKQDEKNFLWWDFATRGVNVTGLHAIPAGVRTAGGSYTGLGIYADWWSGTESDAGQAFNRSLVWIPIHPGKTKVYRNSVGKDWGFSIRCTKDRP